MMFNLGYFCWIFCNGFLSGGVGNVNFDVFNCIVVF